MLILALLYLGLFSLRTLFLLLFLLSLLVLLCLLPLLLPPLLLLLPPLLLLLLTLLLLFFLELLKQLPQFSVLALDVLQTFLAFLRLIQMFWILKELDNVDAM